MLDHFPLPTQGKPERRHLYRWIRAEETYVYEKYDATENRPFQDASFERGGLEDYWAPYVTQYLDRARDALDGARALPEGPEKQHLILKAQQAMAKCMMTAKGMVESSIRAFGPMPRPGVPSGTVEPWIDPAYPPPADD